MNIDLNTASNAELVAEYNRLAAIVGATPTKRFADRKSGLRRIEGLMAQLPEKQEQVNVDIAEYEANAPEPVLVKGKKVYPLEYNQWHARNHKKHGRSKRQVIEMVFQALLNAREGVTETRGDGEVWQAVYLDNAIIEGMHPRIWAGHLSQLRKEGRYLDGMVLVG